MIVISNFVADFCLSVMLYVTGLIKIIVNQHD